MSRDDIRLHLIPSLLDQVWRHYATTSSGLCPTALAPRGVTHGRARELERLAAIEGAR